MTADPHEVLELLAGLTADASMTIVTCDPTSIRLFGCDVTDSSFTSLMGAKDRRGLRNFTTQHSAGFVDLTLELVIGGAPVRPCRVLVRFNSQFLKLGSFTSNHGVPLTGTITLAAVKTTADFNFVVRDDGPGFVL